MKNIKVNNTSIFTAREKKMLEAFIPLIERLLSGESEPSNPQQLALLQVADGTAVPVTALEKAWIKHERRRAFEEDGTPIAIISRNAFNPYTPSDRDKELADY